MQVKSTFLVVVSNVLFGIVLARGGMLGDETDGELPPLKLKGVERVPEEGVITYANLKEGTDIECKLKGGAGDESKNGKETVKDLEWKWVRLEIDEDHEEEEIPLNGQVKSKVDAKAVKDAVGWLTGWIRLKCSSGDNFAEFRVDAGNKTKAPKLPFRVKAFDKSLIVVEKEDFTVFCEIVNRTRLVEGETIEQGIKRLKNELNVKWYRWSEAEDHSYAPPPTDEPAKHNCTEEAMEGSKWIEMKTSQLKQGDIDPHIKMINNTDDEGKNWGFKLEDALYDDRRAYKCVVYNKTQPQNCSESVFFLRVKDKYAALWPFIGIVAEVVVLCIVIFVCEHGKNSKEEFEDEGQNGNGVGIGGQGSGPGENSNVRRRT